jgi:hypothetical protein
MTTHFNDEFFHPHECYLEKILRLFKEELNFEYPRSRRFALMSLFRCDNLTLQQKIQFNFPGI